MLTNSLKMLINPLQDFGLVYLKINESKCSVTSGVVFHSYLQVNHVALSMILIILILIQVMGLDSCQVVLW